MSGTGSVTATLADAERLFEDKIQRLRSDVGRAEQQAKFALEQKDKALSEVTTLQQEKDRLIHELDKAKTDKQQILDSLAEHRKNVEASLAKQEAAANEAISAAAVASVKLEEERRAVEQFRSQIVGIKHTIQAELTAKLDDLTAVVAKTQEALQAIPDALKTFSG